MVEPIGYFFVPVFFVLTGMQVDLRTLADPQIVIVALGITAVAVRWQSTWPAKDIFHEYANDFAKKVNDMAGGRLKIEVLPAGAVVPAFGLLDAVPRARSTAAMAWWPTTTARTRRWRCGARARPSAWTRTCCWPGTTTAAARRCSTRSTSLNLDVVSFLYGPMPTQPFGWFKKPVTKRGGHQGLKFRTVGLAVDMFTDMGAAVNPLPGGEIVPALDRGLIDGGRVQQRQLRPPARLPRREQELHAAELPPEWRAVRDPVQQGQVRRLPAELKSIIDYAVEAASADMSWKAIDRYSKDYIELKKPASSSTRRPTPSCARSWRRGTRSSPRRRAKRTRCSRRSTRSQKAFAQRAAAWQNDYTSTSAMAYNHYFGKKARAAGRTGCRPGHRPAALPDTIRHSRCCRRRGHLQQPSETCHHAKTAVGGRQVSPPGWASCSPGSSSC
jgi:TRAP-type mannitol/chloroaromatic compound transport system substrate-binding protein